MISLYEEASSALHIHTLLGLSFILPFQSSHLPPYGIQEAGRMTSFNHGTQHMGKRSGVIENKREKRSSQCDRHLKNIIQVTWNSFPDPWTNDLWVNCQGLGERFGFLACKKLVSWHEMAGELELKLPPDICIFAITTLWWNICEKQCST